MKKHTILNVSVLATLLASLLSCVGIATEEQQKSTIPGSVLANFPGYHLLTLKERDSDNALLLKDDKSPMTKLVVLLCSNDDHCRNVYELDVTMYSDLVFLRPVSRPSKSSSVIE